MGLAQRAIEQAGFASIAVSNIPDLTAAVGVPRLAAIEYPFGRTLGQPGDREGQLAVLRAILQAMIESEEPGSIRHLPFEWPETPKEVRAHRSAPPPIAGYLKRYPWQLPRLLSRNIPEN